ncbi:MAG TPA: L-seryl-tRNA(Sec) selenium transferase [Vicinamibacterales bacterium]|nr:L-seryl-tRNA(Sec) selenium transferase [Vicinamibacterales bacterium]
MPRENVSKRLTSSRLRAIPPVDQIMRLLGDIPLPRPMVLSVVRRELAALRSRGNIPAPAEIVARTRLHLQELNASRIRPVINATGILVHTNFGRAPLGANVLQALEAVASNYINLEYSLTDGTRGRRAAYLERGLALLCGAEAATVVNNNAAALVLILRHFCRPPNVEVVVSRGELVQIGGGFRIPDLLESTGAKLREVGTTNHTSSGDYARGISKRTALVLKVHRSNFFMDGFVASPSTEAIASVARSKRVPLVEDLGGGALVDTDTIEGLEHEPTPREVIRQGVDLVCFSGDKLFGGPQAGVIAGRRRLIDALKREPLFRALRCDKLILSALETTVEGYLREEPATPLLALMRATNDELRVRAERMIEAIGGLPLTGRIGAGRAQVGGGALPRSVLPSVTLDLTHSTLKPQELARRLRDRPLPVIGYVARGSLKLDLRTIFPAQDETVIAALRAVSTA